MRFLSSAPGKVILIGEYAVLCGKLAIASAVNRRVYAEVNFIDGEDCYLETKMNRSSINLFKTGENSGIRLIDIVNKRFKYYKSQAWKGKIDSSELYDYDNKLGLGSSSATLLSWSSIFLKDISLEEQISIYKNLQNNLGSGIDLAVSKFGGTLVYKNSQESGVDCDPINLPSGINYSIVYTGIPISTKSYIISFNKWRINNQKKYNEIIASLGDIVENCYLAIKEDSPKDFLKAISFYNFKLDILGSEIGINIVSKEHKEILNIAKKYDLDYKVSGSGGGDIGIVFSDDIEALAKFNIDIEKKYKIIDAQIDSNGLNYEEFYE
tara:strand:- start:20970 stop:21941 length:972 start_codon:yes stop_codon:yes gene_type:complete